MKMANEVILESIQTVRMLDELQPENEKFEYEFNFPSLPEHFATLLKMQDFNLK